MSLFWYPELNEKFSFDKPIPKGALMHSYDLYYLLRLQSMFKYDGLPESVPAKWLEHYLLVNGSCVFVMDGDELICTTGGWGGLPNRYYIPTEYIVSNPYVKESTRRTYTIGEDCVLARNDTYAHGLLPLIQEKTRLLTENYVSMNMSTILTRAMLNLVALTGQDKESIDLWLKKLERGELGAILSKPNFAGNDNANISAVPFAQVAGTLTDLIEERQYIKASLYNDIGLNGNYNMKREAINSNESQLNDDMLHPLIDEMLKCRKEFVEEVNDMFGTNITVEFDSAWADNELENEAALEAIEAQATMTEEAAEVTPIEEETEETAADPEDYPDDVPAEETSEEITEEDAPEDQTEEQPDIVDVLEDLTDAVEQIAEEISEDGPSEETEEKESEE